MGKRFLRARYPLDCYSLKRATLRLNEGDFEPHRMRPYGLPSSHFSYRQMFQKKHGSRQGRRAEDRAAKKAARKAFFYGLWCSASENGRWE